MARQAPIIIFGDDRPTYPQIPTNNTPVITNYPVEPVILPTVYNNIMPPPDDGQNNIDVVFNNTYGNAVTSPVNCNCLIGTPYIENGVCKCSDRHIEQPNQDVPVKVIDTKNGQPVIYTTTVNQPTNNTSIFETLSEAIKKNPLIALAGAAFIAHSIFKKK